MKLKSPYRVRYRLSMGFWDMEVISGSEKCASAIGAKNIPIYFNLTRLIVNVVCHIIHDNDIDPVSIAATNLLWDEFP